MPKGELLKEVRQQIQITKLTKSVAKLRIALQEKDAIIQAQADEINELKAKLEEKESQRKLLSGYLYQKKRKQEDRQPWGKKPGAPGFHRPKPKDEEVTSEQAFSLNKCPMCRGEVGQAVDTVVKYEEDIDLAPRKVTKKYTITRHWCSHCETFVKVQDIPPISRIGLNVLGYILYARYRLRLPIERIKESLADLHDFQLSEGEITEKLQEAETLFGKDHQSIIELIKQAKIVYADETGWRMDGENWWLWAFRSQDGVRYMLEMSRGKGVPQDALGQKQDRVIVSDGYAVYKNLPGDKQQCWVHVLRIAKHVSAALYQDLVTLYLRLGTELTKPLGDRDPPYFEKQLQEISGKQYQEPLAQKVQERIKRNHQQLLTCLKYQDVFPENNTAERVLRPQVVMRKIFGGCRSPAGARAHEVNTSVLDTLRIQNPKARFFDVVMPLLRKRYAELHSGL